MFRQIDDRTIVVEQTPQLPMFRDKPEPPRREAHHARRLRLDAGVE